MKTLLTLSLSLSLLSGTGGYFLGNYVPFANSNEEKLQEEIKKIEKKTLKPIDDVKQTEKDDLDAKQIEVKKNIILKKKDIDVETGALGNPIFVVTFDYELPEGSILYNSKEDTAYIFDLVGGMRHSWLAWSSYLKSHSKAKEGFYIDSKTKKGEVKVRFLEEEEAQNLDVTLFEYWDSLLSEIEEEKSDKRRLEDLKKKYNNDENNL